MMTPVPDTFERVACDEETPEVPLVNAASSTSAAEGSPKKRLPTAKIATVVFGIACLASVAAYSAFTWNSDEENPAAPQYSARALLESKEMADVVTRNYVSVWPALSNDEGRLHDEVTAGMRRLTATIKDTEPHVFQQLNDLSLSERQKNNILNVVGSMGDKRIQSVGQAVARLATESKIDGKHKWSREALKRKLEDAFEQNKTKLALLHNEVISAPLRSMLDTGSAAQLSFDPERMHLFRDSKDSWDFEDFGSSRRLIDEWGTSNTASSTDVSETNPGSEFKPSDKDMDEYSTKFEEGLGLLSGMLEQARVALDQIDFVGESFDVDMKIPYWAKSMVGGADFVSELSDCVMRAESNQVKMMMCPMKYASAATDFLESVDNVMGVSNGHMPLASAFGGDKTTVPPDYQATNFAQQPQQPYAPQYAQQQPQQYTPRNADGLYR